MDETVYANVGGAQDVTVALLFFGGCVYLIAVVLALMLWIWSRHELPKQPATTQRGQQLHVAIHEHARACRNRLLLMFVPILVLALLPALVGIHPFVTGLLVAVVLFMTSFVFRDAYRTIRGV